MQTSQVITIIVSIVVSNVTLLGGLILILHRATNKRIDDFSKRFDDTNKRFGRCVPHNPVVGIHGDSPVRVTLTNDSMTLTNDSMTLTSKSTLLEKMSV